MTRRSYSSPLAFKQALEERRGDKLWLGMGAETPALSRDDDNKLSQLHRRLRQLYSIF